jgi:hemerythrin-like domain-containing protein
MTTAQIQDSVAQEHQELRAYLTQWEQALEQLTPSDFFETQRALQRLWRLLPYFEERLPRHFQMEEAQFYPRVEEAHPDCAPALARFLGEHARIARLWQSYKGELQYADAVGETRRLFEQGHELVQLVRQHMANEEQELGALPQA